MTIGWLTAMLDSPPETAAASERFWRRVTGSRLSPSRGPRHEFATLVPPQGDPFLKVQRVVQSIPGGLHLDLHTDDVRGLAARVDDLDARPVRRTPHWTTLRDPAGRGYFLTRRDVETGSLP